MHSEGSQIISRELIPLSALDDIIQDKNGAVVAGFEDEHILIL